MTHAQAQTSTLPGPASVTAADVVVGIATYNDAGRIGQALRSVVTACHDIRGAASCVIVHADGDSADGTRERAAEVTGEPLPILQVSYTLDRVDRMGGPYLGVPAKGNAVRTVFEEAYRLGSKACVIVDLDIQHFNPGWLEALVRPVLDADLDFVAPYYARHKFAGAINNGITYPLTRTLYGKRVRYPMGGDFACSRAFLDRRLRETAWDAQMARSMVDLWLTTAALVDGSRVGQAMIGAKRQAWREPGADPAAPLASVLAALFQGAERWQSTWQKVRGSETVPFFGAPGSADDERVEVDVGEGIETFRLAQRHLDEVWRLVLPPGTLLELKKLAQVDVEAFRMPDALWARCLFDFCLAYHQRTLNREHVLAAFAPLFSAWVSSFVMELRHATPADVDARIDHLCLRFESEKPYLISRWRWPDRFSP